AFAWPLAETGASRGGRTRGVFRTLPGAIPRTLLLSFGEHRGRLGAKSALAPGSRSQVGPVTGFSTLPRVKVNIRRANRGVAVAKMLVPPEELDYGVCVANFPKVGTEYAGYCRELGRLRQDGTILDIGCGFGPLAAALIDYLTPAGRYEGFD